MRLEKKVHRVSLAPLEFWTPWWFRPSSFMLFAMLPAMIVFSFANPSLTASKAQLFYGYPDFIVGLIGFLFLVVGARIGESKVFHKSCRSISGGGKIPQPRLPEAFFSEKVDWILMGIFIFAHILFFRNFITNPGLIAGVLGGNLELKKEFKTIPGVTTWTQVSLVLAAIRGMRWSGLLPGKVKLISLFHIVFFGTLFVRAILWSERLALIEGIFPFFLCAMPKLGMLLKPAMRQLINLLPLLAPFALLAIFIVFEYFRSWQSNAAENANIFVFGWRRLFTYYFEAMNTGSAILGLTGFFDGPSLPMSKAAYESVYDGLYSGSLDPEFNNTSGIWAVAARAGNLMFAPVMVGLGLLTGVAYNSLREGRLFGLIYPIQFMFMFELLRIHYWVGANRVLASTIVILIIIAWAISLKSRVKLKSRQPEQVFQTAPA